MISVNNPTFNVGLNNVMSHWMKACVLLGNLPIVLFKSFEITGINFINAGISLNAEIPAGKSVLPACLTSVHQPGHHHAKYIKHQEDFHRPGRRAGHRQ